jgi:hypothetical protein
MPCSVAAATSILSVPAPRRQITRQHDMALTASSGNDCETTITASASWTTSISASPKGASTHNGMILCSSYFSCSKLVTGNNFAFNRTTLKVEKSMAFPKKAVMLL